MRRRKKRNECKCKRRIEERRRRDKMICRRWRGKEMRVIIIRIKYYSQFIRLD